MKQVQIKNRWTGSVLYTADIPDDTPSGMEMRAALEKATQERANLAGTNLAGANLAGANLAGANLAGTYLAGTNLAGAYFEGANLAVAYFEGANLAGANLAGANLAGANLAGANLEGARLVGADFEGANLAGTYLEGANLAGADFEGATFSDTKWTHDVVINKPPIQLQGLNWNVTIFDDHMQIGCELYSLAEWDEFDGVRILEMGGREALRFWRNHKNALLGLARSCGRSFEKVEK